jgi:hypothetical protein
MYPQGQPQQNIIMVPANAQVGASAPQPAVADPTAATAAASKNGPQHAANLDQLAGIRKQKIVFRIAATPKTLAEADGVANRCTISKQMVESMRAPVGTRNRHLAEQRKGDPSKTIIKSITLGKAYNGFDKHLVGDIDSIVPQAGFANSTRPAAFSLPKTPDGPIDLNIKLEEPTNVMSDKMIQVWGMLSGARYDITKDADPRSKYAHLKTKKEYIDARGRPYYRPTFSVCLLDDMIKDGVFQKAASVSKGIQDALNAPTNQDLTLPRDMLEKVQEEIAVGEAELNDSTVDLYDFGVTLRTHDGSSWTDHADTHGTNVGAAMETKRAEDRHINGIVQEAWVEAEIEYGMLDIEDNE